MFANGTQFWEICLALLLIGGENGFNDSAPSFLFVLKQPIKQ
jgi:hypothetical protein